ncbi:hypothetical protein V6Z11_D02G027900 [Gossypium hirsutum]
MCSFGFKDLLNLCNYFITYFIRFSFANCLYVFTQHIIYVWQGEFHGVCFHYKVNADTTKDSMFISSRFTKNVQGA